MTSSTRSRGVRKVYKLGFIRSHPCPQSRSGLSSVKHFISGNPGNLKPEPLRQFLHAHRKPLELKTPKFHNRTFRPNSNMLPPTYQSGLKGWTGTAHYPSNKVSLVWLHHHCICVNCSCPL